MDLACVGYRDQLDLAFRDQSNTVACKAQHATTNMSSDPKRSTRDFDKASVQSGQVRRVKGAYGVLTKPLHVPYVDQAASFFFFTYDSKEAESLKSIFKYLPSLYVGCQDSAFSSIITALGLAGLSRHRNIPHMMSIATVKYETALRQIREDLQDPAAAKADETLVSVILLGLYEVTVSILRADPLAANQLSDEHVLRHK